MEIALIWAMAKNRVIGLNNGLPWHLPDDMRHFMATTRGHPVIMGRRTFESMPGPLPDRDNIVLTRKPTYQRNGIRVAAEFPAALDIAREILYTSRSRSTVFAIGGTAVYELALPLASQLFVTKIDAEFEGDTWFPRIDWCLWEETESRTHDTDSRHAHRFRISVYRRKTSSSLSNR